MIEKLQEFEVYRKKESKKANIFFITGGSLIAIGAIGMMFVQFLVFIAFVGVVLLALGFSVHNSINKEFKSRFIIDIIKNIYPYNAIALLEISYVFTLTTSHQE